MLFFFYYIIIPELGSILFCLLAKWRRRNICKISFIQGEKNMRNYLQIFIGLALKAAVMYRMHSQIDEVDKKWTSYCDSLDLYC